MLRVLLHRRGDRPWRGKKKAPSCREGVVGLVGGKWCADLVDARALATRRQAVSRSCCRAPQPGLAAIIDANARFTLRGAPAPRPCCPCRTPHRGQTSGESMRPQSRGVVRVLYHAIARESSSGAPLPRERLLRLQARACARRAGEVEQSGGFSHYTPMRLGFCMTSLIFTIAGSHCDLLLHSLWLLKLLLPLQQVSDSRLTRSSSSFMFSNWLAAVSPASDAFCSIAVPTRAPTEPGTC